MNPIDFKSEWPADDFPKSFLRAEVAKLLQDFDVADRRAKRATTLPEREAAEAERRAAAGDFWTAGQQLAELFLLLLRYAKRHQPEAVRVYLVDLLQPELNELAEAIATRRRG